MITPELNQRLTQTAPGTPMGTMLRYYWYPVGTAVELQKEPVQPIRLLSENLTLFRSKLQWEQAARAPYSRSAAGPVGA